MAKVKTISKTFYNNQKWDIIENYTILAFFFEEIDTIEGWHLCRVPPKLTNINDFQGPKTFVLGTNKEDITALDNLSKSCLGILWKNKWYTIRTFPFKKKQEVNLEWIYNLNYFNIRWLRLVKKANDAQYF